MSPLSDFLLKSRICTRDQIDDAVQNQVILGGRLGTNLIEMGYLDERTLAECLGRLHGVSALYGDAIEPEPNALALIPPALVDRLSVVPYRVSARQVQVLCLDPNDFPTLDHVAFQTNRKVLPIVVAEVRLWQLLHQHYGIDRGLRGLALAALPATAVTQVAAPPPPPSFAGDLMSEEAFDSLYQRRAEDEGPGRTQAQAPAAAVAQALPVAALASAPPTATAARPMQAAIPGPRLPPLQQAVPATPPLPAGRTPTAQLPVLTGVVLEEITEELTLDDVIVEAPAIVAPAAPQVLPALPSTLPRVTAVPPPPAAPPPAPLPPQAIAAAPAPPPVDESPLSFAEATARLATARDRDEVAQLVLRFARTLFKRAMLFTVHGRVAVGWDAVGVDLTPLQFARLVVPLDQPSVFQLAVQSRAHVLGAPQKTPTNIQFLGATGKQVPRSAFVMPVLVRGRAVNIFYGDNGHKEHCPSDVGELLILALKIAQSYESLFRAKVLNRGESGA